MTLQEWQIIEPRLDMLLTQLDMVLSSHDEEAMVNKVISTLYRHPKLTWHALREYTRLTSTELACALSLLFDRQVVGQRANGKIRFYYLKRAA